MKIYGYCSKIVCIVVCWDWEFVIFDFLYDVCDIDGQCYEYNNFFQFRCLKIVLGYIINIFICCNDFKL